jgi:hypothetical protein
MTGNRWAELEPRTAKRIEKALKTQEQTKRIQEETKLMEEETKLMRARLDATKEYWEKLNTESALSRNRRSPLLDFIDDLVHRPPNQEQMRQIKELLLEEQQSIAQLIALIDKHLE